MLVLKISPDGYAVFHCWSHSTDGEEIIFPIGLKIDLIGALAVKATLIKEI